MTTTSSALRQDVTACILCSRNCGLSVEIENNQFKKIKGDDQHPFSQGYICQKAARLQHYQQHADRLTSPLKRQADGSFTEVSWEQAIQEIADQLVYIRNNYGGTAFASVGGGGQGNHLGAAYGRQLLYAMKSFYAYNSLAQEKTGDFWVNGRLFGSQACHTTEDVEHADYVLFIGTNPFQAHGIPNARDTLKHIKKDPDRTMVVFDPRVTETAKQADIHVQLKPGTDAYLMSAMIAIMLRENLYDHKFIQQHTHGFDEVKQAFLAVPIEEYIQKADVSVELIYQIVRDFSQAKRGCVRIDLGIQHTLNTTLNGYLEKLLYLLAGHFGKQGSNNLHTMFIPILTNTDERNPKYRRTVHHKMFPISGFFPPNILPDEILKAGEKRVRAVFVDSCNPLLTYPDTAAYEQAFQSLDLLVVVDVAMTETARLAHYILPAHSQFEKWEFTGFNLEFPKNGFHLRHPLFQPQGNTLPEAEIYTRLLEAMKAIPQQFPILSKIAEKDSANTAYLGYFAALGASFAKNKKLIPFAASIVYRTLGKTLPNDAAATALLLPLCMQYTAQHYQAVKQAGYEGNRLNLGVKLFQAILKQRSGVVLSQHDYADVWNLIAYKDKKIRLAIPEMFIELAQLKQQPLVVKEDYPFILLAGERRSYNANQIYRDPAWRKVDADGRLRINPEDALQLGVETGQLLQCISEHGAIRVTVELDDGMRKGVVSLPHGYGLRYGNSEPIGPQINRLTSTQHCDPLSKTPYHKYVPVRLERLST
ncbi:MULTISPECIES: molybdopterin-dependent oxidoreductase [unclassified Acinetobacter]|uniref:molybdopterin-dependent oxidoreductase n=1 Tax=unclassified Acinetobacter TaxID=196816 RepID=UPI0024484DFC|nr:MULTISPECIES: molybdopterin-dependent oxidoreductase [unclassified Acinetobacter]MDH0030188.1 molybdopterin-dependent oxidoreductase [Acinetobacter sp. GD04021]MDH0885756.1 molybdopterin-dependent oxidoreductase [Acinetobacter sp. GD03873]MDH1082376.1 molybdopterin-dependent oxidoreductase [Acinetobacter sp. GD03983]MDH2189232.1 molybdopterin-dependent oxidoreductase [Acinetobacter sp. GD03645]MDH2202420.1 molybdopterin-dependent oxidoreductase [Acinetobacter sp. GD03647]